MSKLNWHELNDMLINLDRTKKMMEENGINALVASSPENFFYASDLYIPFVDRFRGMISGFNSFALIPLDGQPVLCVSALDANLAKQTSWIEDQKYTRTWAYIRREKEIKVYENPISILAEVFDEKGLAKSTVGIEEKTLPIGDFRRIEKKIPEAKFVDASGVFMKTRMVKTEEEIQRIRKATEITEKAFEAAFEIAKEGTTEVDLLREFQQTIIQEAGYLDQGLLHSNLTIGKETATVRRSWPLEKLKLKRGDPIRFDGGAIYKGYRADLARCRVLGTPSSEVTKVYSAICKGQKAIVDAIRPGISFSDLFRMGLDAVREMGFPDYTRGHLGHGLGIITEEEPLVAPNNQALLEKDMVLSIEVPYYWVDVGGFNVEDTIIVTNRGREVFSRLHRDLEI